MKKPVGELILKGTITIQVFMILAKIMGFLQKMVIAFFAGTGAEADTYLWAYSGLIFTFMVIPQQLVAPVLPVFVSRRKSDGEREAWRFLGSTGLLLTIGMLTFVLAAMWGAEHLVRATSQFNSTGSQFHLAVALTRIMLPSALFMGLFSFAVLIMHADKRFALPAFGETLNRIIIVAVTVILFSTLGVKAIGVGIVAGSAACLFLLLLGFRNKWPLLFVRPSFHDSSLSQLRKLVPPILLGILIAQGRSMLDLWFVSGMAEGKTASLMYAKSLADTLILLIAFPVGIVAYPYFSDLASEKDKHEAAQTLMNVVRIMIFIFAPISVGIVLLRFPIVRLVFERGKFISDSVELTASPFLFYAIGLTAFAVEIVFMRFYFALKDTLTPIIVGIVCTVIHISVVIIFHETLSHQSIALAALISKSVKVTVLYWLLKSRIPNMQFAKNVVFGLKISAAAAIMGFAVYFLRQYTGVLFPIMSSMSSIGKSARLACQLGVCVSGGILVFVTTACALRIEEAGVILARIRKSRH
ncbi:MAG: hypothetical protein JXN60_05915 [Lentisphaerae bacterium]|nr:hypothetical protein [Lentisphaerota bacterium]